MFETAVIWITCNIFITVAIRKKWCWGVLINDQWGFKQFECIKNDSHPVAANTKWTMGQTACSKSVWFIQKNPPRPSTVNNNDTWYSVLQQITFILISLFKYKSYQHYHLYASQSRIIISHGGDITFQYMLQCFHKTMKQYIRLSYGQSWVPIWRMIFKMSSILQRYYTASTKQWNNISDWLMVNGFHFEEWFSKCRPFCKDITLLPRNNETYQIACMPFGEALWVPSVVTFYGIWVPLEVKVMQIWMPVSRAIVGARFGFHLGRWASEWRCICLCLVGSANAFVEAEHLSFYLFHILGG